jgi:Holliday junction resolvase RusA-like endonuclease
MSLLEVQQPKYRVTAFGLEFTVYGHALPGGSKRPLRRGGKKDGRIILVDNNPKTRDWRNDIKIVAAELMKGRELYEGALALDVTFFVLRPKGHYGSYGVKKSAPKFPTKRPDTTKLLRPLEDALTGIIWRDDAQIVTQTCSKRYGEPERVEVKVSVVI